MKIFVNGKIVNEKEAKISVFDRGLLYGDGLFETMRSYNGIVFLLDRHLDRLYNSARLIDIEISRDKRYLKSVIYTLLKMNSLRDAYIRLAVTRGKGRVGLDVTTAKKQNIIIIVKRFVPYPERFYKRGITLYTSSIKRDERSLLSRIKSINYLSNIIGRLEAKKRGATDALFLNTKGEVAESAVSNIFMVKKGKLFTPPVDSGALPGITREVILSIADEAGMCSFQESLKLNVLKNADEVFLTNTLMEVMPVVKIDKKKIKDGKPGHYTKLLHRLYRLRTNFLKT